MRLLITGATGLVGRALLCRLLTKSELGMRVALRRQISDLPAGVESVQVGEIGPDTDWQAALPGIDVVIHTAARVHVMCETAVDPLVEFRHVNVTGTLNLAQQATRARVRRFIFISSIKVNGESTEFRTKGLGEKATDGQQGFSEDDTPNPQDPYGISKWEAEQALIRIADETGLGVVIIRPPLIYGPGVKANFLQMIEVVNRGIPLLLASIKNQRSLVYLGNLVDAIVTCINHPKAAGQTYLVSDGEDVSTPELIRRVAAAMGRPARLLPFPPALMRMAGKLTGKSEAVDKLLGSLVVDSSKIRRELNWSPPYTMEQGLEETAEWFKTSFEQSGKGAKKNLFSGFAL